MKKITSQGNLDVTFQGSFWVSEPLTLAHLFTTETTFRHAHSASEDGVDEDEDDDDDDDDDMMLEPEGVELFDKKVKQNICFLFT